MKNLWNKIKEDKYRIILIASFLAGCVLAFVTPTDVWRAIWVVAWCTGAFVYFTIRTFRTGRK